MSSMNTCAPHQKRHTLATLVLVPLLVKMMMVPPHHILFAEAWNPAACTSQRSDSTMSRRSMIQRVFTTGSTVVGCTMSAPKSAFSVLAEQEPHGVLGTGDDSENESTTATKKMKEEAELRKRKQKEDQERRRIAEETKKRLAVGRIGII